VLCRQNHRNLQCYEEFQCESAYGRDKVSVSYLRIDSLLVGYPDGDILKDRQLAEAIV